MSFFNYFRNANIPTPARAAELQNNFRGQCEKAADAIAESDVLLVVTGAGFSADSGLAVYADVARIPAYRERNLDYSDICEPHHLYSDPELFYGFWGQCFNDYRKTKPHRGYEIIARWRDDKQQKNEEDCSGNKNVASRIQHRIKELSQSANSHYDVSANEEPSAGAFYIFTSNVDAHSYDYFRANEIYECHGNIELWQCSSRGFSCSSGIWRAPLSHEFFVDQHTMLAPRHRSTSNTAASHDEIITTKNEDDTSTPCIGQTKGIGRRTTQQLLRHMPEFQDKKGWHQLEGENWPTCGHCDDLARPAILMFADAEYKYDKDQERRWGLWRKAVVDTVYEDENDENLRVCILEIGCGMNVPTCRYTSEAMMGVLSERGCGKVTLVRINPDLPLVPTADEDDERCDVISIMSKGLTAIEQIDELYKQTTSN